MLTPKFKFCTEHKIHVFFNDKNFEMNLQFFVYSLCASLCLKLLETSYFVLVYPSIFKYENQLEALSIWQTVEASTFSMGFCKKRFYE